MRNKIRNEDSQESDGGNQRSGDKTVRPELPAIISIILTALAFDILYSMGLLEVAFENFFYMALLVFAMAMVFGVGVSRIVRSIFGKRTFTNHNSDSIEVSNDDD